ncbi:energy transducer TonB [bacterium]|nr:energy transducer TonB [bacterium]
MQGDINISNKAFKSLTIYRFLIAAFLIILICGNTGSAMSFSGRPVFPPEYPIMKYEDVDIEPQLIGGSNAIDKSILDLGLYPEEAEEKGIQGSVEVQFIVDEKGRIDYCIILEENPEGYGFGLAAREAVLKAEYKPGIHCNRPARVLMRITVQFII